MGYGSWKYCGKKQADRFFAGADALNRDREDVNGLSGGYMVIKDCPFT
jgi:hypothetical protein